MNPTDLSAFDLSAAIYSKQISCREVMQAYLAQIDTLNPLYNAIVSLADYDDLLNQADAHDALMAAGKSKGWMHGMPQAIKDLAPAAGFPTTMGSPLLAKNVATEDGLMASRMRRAGAIIIGKTNTPEFGLGSHTFNTVFGATRNAFDLDRTAGGSSGGAAVALTKHMLPVADGSDFMGSLRNPAAWNNIVGMRPSQGRVPMWPVADTWVAQLGTEGPMGRNVRDVAMLLQTQSGFDERCPLSLSTIERFADNLQGFDAGQLRIGWLGDLQRYLPFEDGILALCEKALHVVSTHGVKVAHCKPNFDPAKTWEHWLVWRKWLVSARLAPLLANPLNRKHMKDEAIWEFEQAQGLTAQQVMLASEGRSQFYQSITKHFEQFDVLAIPSAQVWPFAIDTLWPKQINGRTMDTYHRWMEAVIYATFAGLPCVSVPVGFGSVAGLKSDDSTVDLPMGLQLIGRPHGDAALLQAAQLFESILA